MTSTPAARSPTLHDRDDSAIALNGPKEGEFYILGYDYTSEGRGNGVVFDNEEGIVTPPERFPLPEGAGFPHFNRVPRLLYDPDLGDMPRDLQSGVVYGYWLVSETLKTVFESVDPDGFAFARCEFILHDGSEGPPHYLCTVIRTLDAVDEKTSIIRIEHDDGFPSGKYYNMTGGARFAFKKEVVGTDHVFLTPYSTDPFCSRVLRDALINHGFGRESSTRGVSLEDAAACGIYALPARYWPENQ